MLGILSAKHRLWFFLWCAIVLLIYFLPGNQIKVSGWLSGLYFDKIVHFLLFFIWFTLYFFSRSIKEWEAGFRPAVAFMLFVFLGAFLEILQSKISIERSFDLMDIAANYSGGCLGYLNGKNRFKIA